MIPRRSLILFLFLFLLQANAGEEQKPILYIVHADACAPCRCFDQVYQANRELREALHEAFDVRSLDWTKPDQAALAMRLGADRVPTYLVVNHNRIVARHVGFVASRDPQAVAAAVQWLMLDLHVEWPRRRPAQPETVNAKPETIDPQPETTNQDRQPPQVNAPTPSGPTIDKTARDEIVRLATQSRDVQAAQQQTQASVEQLQTSVSGLQRQISETRESLTNTRNAITEQLSASHESTRTEIHTLSDRLRETIANTIAAPAATISTEIPPALSFAAPSATPTSTAGDGFASGLIKAGLTGVAVYFGLPVAGVGLGAAAVAWMLRRRTARKAASGGFRAERSEATSPGAGSATPCNTPYPRQLDEARELLRLREREGRHPLHDALFGMLADSELDAVVHDPDPATAAAAVRLRDRVTQRFNQIAPLSTSQQDYVS